MRIQNSLFHWLDHQRSLLRARKLPQSLSACVDRAAKVFRQGLFVTLYGLLVCVVFGSLSSCAWLDNKQRQTIYRPTPGVPANFAGLKAPDESYFLTPQSSDGKATEQIDIWWLPNARAGAPTLLYLHGTFRNLPQNLGKMEALRRAGFSVLAVDYRGWGRSTAITPSEQSIVQDAELAFAELARREPRAAQRVIYGHSMGSGVATTLASRRKAGQDYGALILESAFTSMPEVARNASWLGFLAPLLTNERFDSLAKIKNVDAPLLMLHGSADKTIPQVLGERLFAAAPGEKTWVSIAGGTHSRLHEEDAAGYLLAVQSFMRKHLPKP
jgi:uncharacterized protein